MIVTLDLGAKLGWAMYSPSSGCISGCWKNNASPKMEKGAKFCFFRTWLFSNVQSGSEVWYEDVLRHAGTHAAHAYGGYEAILTSYCHEHGIPYHGVGVKTIKKYVTGNGNSTKQMMIQSAIDRGFKVKDDNEADALGLMCYVLEKELGYEPLVRA